MAGKRKLTARQVRYLFATGRLRASGSGKNRKVTYSKDAGKSRSERIAAGREKAQAFLGSERGQRLRSGVEALRATNRRTGRRDYGKEAKVKAAKDDLRAAGVKIKTGQALAKKYDTPRLRGDYSGRTFVRDAPRYAEQKRVAARKAERAAARESVIAPVRGKSRAERIAAGRAIADSSFRVQAFRRDRQRTAEAQAKANRLRGRNSRVARLEKKQQAETERRLDAAIRRDNVRERRLKGSAQYAARRERAQRIAAGRAVYAAFKAKRDSLYSGSLF